MSMPVQTDTSTIEHDLIAELRVLRQVLKPRDGTRQDYALCAVETFAAIALRVIAKTDPELVKSEARNVELQARLERRPVIREAA